MNLAEGKVAAAVIAGLAALLLAGLVFFLTRAAAGEVPPMPRAEFSPEEERAAAVAIAGRGAAHRVTDPERDLEHLLAELGRAEADTGRAHGEQVLLAMKAFSEGAQSLAARDRERYLAFGDHLAARFAEAVEGLLSAARQRGLARAMDEDRSRVEEIERLGGNFLSRAAERGLLRDDGVLDGPGFLPAVLFLARWRSLAGFSRVQGFEPAELRAYLDFLAAFSSHDAATLRLESVDSLAALDPAYDAVVARALVLYQGGRLGEARETLLEAVRAGRDDTTAKRFLRFLDP